MQLTAKLIQQLPIQSGTSINGPWSKQNIIVETTDDYPKKVSISIWNGRVDINDLEIGKEYLFHVNVESNEYSNKWYTTLTLWQIRLESTEQTGRPMLDILSPKLKGNESNLEIIQKFQEEIYTDIVYTKGIKIGNEISDEKLIVDQRVLDFIENFKRWLNEVAFINISGAINQKLLEQDGFLKYPVVVQKYLINTILETYYGYKPIKEEISPNNLKVKADEENDIGNTNLERKVLENHDQSEKDISQPENNQSGLWKGVIPSIKVKNSTRDEILKELESEDQSQDSDFIL